MELSFYNSLTRQQEPFHSLKPHQVGMYSCGPTVYNYAHIGNFRAYLFEDLLRRTLEFAGYKVTQVMNLTDVDDKTIRGSQAKQMPLADYTRPYIDSFFADLKALNVEPAEVYPPATAHIPEMKQMIQVLFDKGIAYKSEDGSVYFSVDRFPSYGRLAHLDRSQLRSGVRISTDEYEKESFGDFAIWKGWDEKDGDVVWEAPWGKGRPGWHLECSAMSMKYLGESFDLHTGGIDNLFPHHENEIAQAEAVTGKPFVQTWMHCAHLRVNGQKMSKSLGNFFTLRDLLDKGYSGREIRYVLLGGHYRQPLNFTFDALSAARAALARIDECVDALTARAGEAQEENGVRVPSSLEAFAHAVADDLNSPEAFSALFAFVRAANAALQAGLSPVGAKLALEEFAQMDRVLGIITFGRNVNQAVPAEIQALAAERLKARAEKNWSESDRLRDLLAEKGWQIRDSKEGQTLKVLAK
ncbi:MAG: cysteine--tRNA ligase [Kiritimatiellia bacterium]